MNLAWTPAESGTGAAGGDSLAHRLEQGPIPLSLALECARDVADQLRELHEEGRAHGGVDPHLIELRKPGAVLLPPNDVPEHPSPLADIVGFGSVMEQMLRGHKPSTDSLIPASPHPAPRKGPGAVLAAAFRLADRCMSAVPETVPSMQKVLTEVRLLSVMLRQCETEASTPLEQPGAQPAEGTVQEPLAGEAEKPEALEESEPAASSRSTGQADEDELDEELYDDRCPRCRCSKVRISRPRNRLERILSTIGLPVRRCHRCYFRYIDFLKACIEMPTRKHKG